MARYEAITMDGQRIDNRGRGYVSRRAAQLACDRRGMVAVETRHLGTDLPQPNDAEGWDRLRMERGHPSR